MKVGDQGHKKGNDDRQSNTRILRPAQGHFKHIAKTDQNRDENHHEENRLSFVAFNLVIHIFLTLNDRSQVTWLLGLRLKFYLDILFFGLICFEELILFEAQNASDKIGWENLDLGVEVTDVAIVKAASGLNFILSIRQFIL